MTNTECACKICVECCKRNPGWFGSIQEIEGAAKIMGVDLKTFLDEFCIQEYWAEENEHIICPTPRRITNDKGFQKASWGNNFDKARCVFLENERCLIHNSKPKECRLTMGCKENVRRVSREDIMLYWKTRQDKITNL